MKRLHVTWHETRGNANAHTTGKPSRAFMLRKYLYALGALVALASSAALSTAQQPTNDQGVPVEMIVTVEAKHKQPIPTITQQDVMVYQGHDRREVTGWIPATGDHAGLELAVLIDDSAGFSLGTQLNDIRTFVGQQAPTTAVALGYMENGTVRIAQNFTKDHAAVAKAVRLALGFSAAGSSPYLSLSDFIKHWPVDPAYPRREVLMISSGIDYLYTGTLDNPYVDAAILDAQCAHVVVYSIYTPSAGHFGHSYFRAYWGQNYLSEVSEMTGGESYYITGPQAPVSFVPYLKEVNQQLPNQFFLGFLAKPEKKATAEGMKVTSEIHDVDFVHANVVCVPASPKE